MNEPSVNTSCGSGKLHLEVPSEVVHPLKFVPLKHFNDTNYKTAQPKRAYLPHFCQFPSSRSLMIVEFDEELEVDFPCLIKEDGLKIGDVFNITMVREEGEIRIETINVSEVAESEFVVKSASVSAYFYLKGAPLHKKMENKWAMIGFFYDIIGFGTPGGPMGLKFYFKRMSYYQEPLCQSEGICDVPISTTTPVPIESKKTEKKEEKEVDNGKETNSFELILLLISLFL
uniref:Uncharacterized protein n=1 Tax=Caenorhabditis tropicalis TaxID=1561998 RepID=A0A1I7UVA9_9PELO